MLGCWSYLITPIPFPWCLPLAVATTYNVERIADSLVRNTVSHYITLGILQKHLVQDAVNTHSSPSDALTRTKEFMASAKCEMRDTRRMRCNSNYAERYGLPTVLHFAGSPIAFMANLHCAAAIPSFIALENHALDLPFWKDLVTGLPENLIEDGYARVPEKPGLGVDLNLEGIEKNLRSPGLFEPTDEWNTPKLGFWKPDRRWD